MWTSLWAPWCLANIWGILADKEKKSRYWDKTHSLHHGMLSFSFDK